MDRYRCAVALLLVAGFFFLISNSPLNIYDEGLVLYAAERIVRGDLPYLDFQLQYTPGQFYVVAALFQAFGHSLFVERMWDAAVRVLLVVAGFALARTLMPEGPAAAAALLIMLRLGAAGFHGFAMLPGLAFGLLSGACLLASFPRRRRGWLISAGLLAGVAVLFRQDVGGFAAVTGLGILAAWRRFSSRPRWDAAPGPASGGFAPYVFGLVAVIGPPALFFLWRVGPTGLWQEMVVYPRSVLIAGFSLPYTDLIPDFRVLFSVPGWRLGHVEQTWGRWTDFSVPVIAYVWSTAHIVRVLWRDGLVAAGRREIWTLIFLTAMGLALLGYALYRFDPIHAVAPFVPAAVLISRGLWLALAPRQVTLCALGAGLAALALGFLWVGVPLSNWLMGTLTFRPPVCATPLARTGCVDLREYQRSALELVRRLTAPSEPLFVGVSRHHRVPQNDTSFYFLADRGPATRFHELLAGAATPVAIQEEMIARLKRPELRHIVLYAGYEDPSRPQASGDGSGAPLFDAYVREAFREVVRFGPYSILEKRARATAAAALSLRGRARAAPGRV